MTLSYASRLALAATVLALSLTSALAQQLPEQRERPASVTGVVTIDGRPAAGVPVWALGGKYLRDRHASSRTDAEGRYRLEGLQPGRYVIVAAKAGYVVPIGEGPESLFPYGRAVTVDEGEALEAVDFALARGGVITGRVTDDRGRPMAGVSVDVETVGEKGDSVSVTLVRPDALETDDRGVYRAYGLPPGRYLVSVEALGGDTNLGSKIYAPAASSPQNARVVSILGSDEAREVDVVVPIGPSSDRLQVQGRVVDADSAAVVADTVVSLLRSTDDEATYFRYSSSTTTNEAGEFRVANVRPGRYRIVAYRPCGPECRYLAGTVDLDVAANVDDVTVSTRRGATMEGQVVLEGVSEPSVLTRLRTLRVTTQLIRTADTHLGRMYDRGVQIGAGGTFRLSGRMPGTHDVKLGDSESASGFHLLRVEGVASQVPNTITVEDARDLSGVRIVVGYGAAVIRGRIRYVNGTPDPRRMPRISVSRENPIEFEFPAVGAHDEFTVDGLLPGLYEVTADVGGIREAVETVTIVRNGESVEVTLTIDLSDAPPRSDGESGDNAP